MPRQTKLNIFLSLSTIFLILPNNTQALQCLCNYCPTDTCDTVNNQDSACFKSVEKLFVPENKSFILDRTFGCISGGDGLLAPLQCHASSLKHTEPKFVSCCKDQDYCNEYLPDPNKTNDPRWELSEEIVSDPQYASFGKILRSIIILVTLTISMVLYLIYLVFHKLKIFITTKTTSSNGDSICSLKADLEKFTQNFASSSASTRSYSLSDPLSHKLETSPALMASCTSIDLTSGIGEPMLNKRTIARAVGCGPTDHVGNGRFGRVFKGQYHGEDVAVKAFRTMDEESWRREDTIFKKLNHENIVRFIASEVTTVDTSSTEFWMFLEYCPCGSLCDYLDQCEVMGPQQAIRILYSIIKGLNYLHEDYNQSSGGYKPSIAHRDIKSKNILMKTPDTCCIADFGHALMETDLKAMDCNKFKHIQVGTVRYMAPEILRKNSSLNYKQFYTFAQADLYQYGLILWEVCYRTALDILHPAGNHKLPYDGVVPQNPDIDDMIKIVCDDQFRPPRCDKWDKYPIMKCLTNLMVECWRPNPKARMETLGVKKRIKEMHDQCIPNELLHRYHYQLNLFDNFSSTPNFRNDRDKTRSNDITM